MLGGGGDDTFTGTRGADTLGGGDGKDTILIDYAKDSASVHANGVTLQTSEWLNSKGVDVLDIRSLTTRVQLDDAFVGRADAGSFEVITNKIVQNDSVKSVADEASSRTQIDLTTVGASRLVKVTGGEGRETVIVTDALNGVQTISGGNGLDVGLVQRALGDEQVQLVVAVGKAEPLQRVGRDRLGGRRRARRDPGGHRRR